jgi:hypothetical protein
LILKLYFSLFTNQPTLMRPIIFFLLQVEICGRLLAKFDTLEEKNLDMKDGAVLVLKLIDLCFVAGARGKKARVVECMTEYQRASRMLAQQP